MKSTPPLKVPQNQNVGDVVRRRLSEIKRSPEELAEAAQVPAEYIADLIAGRRRPPLPGRTDLYERMTPFLRLGRNDLAACARAERARTAPNGGMPNATVGRTLLALCEPGTARELERRAAERDSAELAGLIQRLLEVTQGAVRRVLDDQIALRIAAARRGATYAALRMRVLEFLDATADTLTTEDLAEFFQPRIAQWDVDLQTGVLRVVLRGQDAPERGRRRPNSRRNF